MVGREEPFQLFILGGVLFTLTSFSYFSSFKYIPASMAALIFYSYPALVSVGSSYINKEYLSITLILAIGVSFTGLVFLFRKNCDFSQHQRSLAGRSRGFIIYVLYPLRKLHHKRRAYQVVVAYVCFFSAISFLILGSAARGLALPNASSTWVLLCFVAFVSLFGFLAFFLGVELTLRQ